MSTIETELVEHIRTEIAYDRAGSLEPDEPLLAGALDSTDVLRLVVFIEDRWGVRIDDDELVPENFDTVNSLAALLRTKGASG